MKRLVAMALIALFCLPLAGCDDVTDNSYKVLKAADITYNGVMNGAAMAYKQEFITKDKLAHITHYATIYHSSWKTACTVLQEYQLAEKSGDETEKKFARKTLELALAVMSNHLTELQTCWAATREAYNHLKKDSHNG